MYKLLTDSAGKRCSKNTNSKLSTKNRKPFASHLKKLKILREKKNVIKSETNLLFFQKLNFSYLISSLNSLPGEKTILSVRSSVCHSEFSIVFITMTFSLNRGFK